MTKYDLELEIGLEDLAVLFQAYGWSYAGNGVYGVPTPGELQSHILRLSQEISDEADFIRSGRISLMRCPEYPDSFEVYLDLGYLSPALGDDGDSAVEELV